MPAPSTAEAEVDDQLAPVGDAEARAIVAHAIDRYIAGRHARVEGFVDRHFSLIGSLRLHRQALGLDLVRAPANVLLMLPYLTMQLGGAGLRRLGASARRAGLAAVRRSSTPMSPASSAGASTASCWSCPTTTASTAARATRWPRRSWPTPASPPRSSDWTRSPERQARDPEQQARLRRLLDAYASTRAAAADLVNNVLLASAGMAAFHKLTPGTLTLGPVIARRSRSKRRSRAFRSASGWAACGTGCSRWRRLQAWSPARPGASSC